MASKDGIVDGQTCGIRRIIEALHHHDRHGRHVEAVLQICCTLRMLDVDIRQAKQRRGANEVADLLAIGQRQRHYIQADRSFFVHVPALATARGIGITVRFTTEDAILARLKHPDLADRLVTEFTERDADVFIDPDLIDRCQRILVVKPPAYYLLAVDLFEIRTQPSKPFRL